MIIVGFKTLDLTVPGLHFWYQYLDLELWLEMDSAVSAFLPLLLLSVKYVARLLLAYPRG